MQSQTSEQNLNNKYSPWQIISRRHVHDSGRVGGVYGLRGPTPMAVFLRPFIKPDRRFSRIRLSEGHSPALLLRRCLFPRRPRGQPIKTVAFVENFERVRRPQGLAPAALAPEPAFDPVGHILVEPGKGARAVGVVEIPAPAFE